MRIMGQKTTFRRLRFTLVELMMAMAVFSIIALIMMRFFITSQQIYSSVTQRNNLYTDSRIALDMMSRELQAAKYNNGVSPAEGIYPFWFEKMKTYDFLGTLKPDPIPPCPDYYYNMDFYSDQATFQFELTQLNFIASTDMKPDAADSDICEIRYAFVPVGMYLVPDTGKLMDTPRLPLVNGVRADDESTMAAIDSALVMSSRPKVIREGWLVRCCTPDKYNNAGVITNNPRWNFDAYPRMNSDGVTFDSCRIFKIWDSDPAIPGWSFGTPPASSTPAIAYQKIIPYVYKLEFSCYTITLTGSIDAIPGASTTVNGTNTVFLSEVKVGDKITVSGQTRTVTAITSNTALTVNSAFPIHAVETAATLAEPVKMSPLKIMSDTDAAGRWSDDPGLRKFGSPLLGSPLPDLVKIELSVLPQSDWFAWKAAVQKDDNLTAQIIINKKLRTFSKTVYLENKY